MQAQSQYQLAHFTRRWRPICQKGVRVGIHLRIIMQDRRPAGPGQDLSRSVSGRTPPPPPLHGPGNQVRVQADQLPVRHIH